MSSWASEVQLVCFNVLRFYGFLRSQMWSLIDEGEKRKLGLVFDDDGEFWWVTMILHPFTHKFKNIILSEVVRIGSTIIFIWVSYEKSSSPYCVMLYFWRGCRGNSKLITLRSERVHQNLTTSFGDQDETRHWQMARWLHTLLWKWDNLSDYGQTTAEKTWLHMFALQGSWVLIWMLNLLMNKWQ